MVEDFHNRDFTESVVDDKTEMPQDELRFMGSATRRVAVVENEDVALATHGHALLMQRNLSLYLHIHCRAIKIFISHNLLPFDLVAQSVEQR